MSDPHHARYEMVVSLTATLRLRTATKAFCNCAVAPDDDEPNAHTCPVCLGLPGALPVLNERAVEQGVRAALALCCTVSPVSTFARRHRFTPELPKGYQITQQDLTLGATGHVQIGETREGAPLPVKVTCVRLEEEPGRAVHGRFTRASAFDFNLAGAPSLRLSSAPEMHSSAEAIAFVRALRRLARGAGASDARFDDGSLRVRARLSIRRLGDTKFGTPCDVVGANSLWALRAALEQEFARQRAAVDRGTGTGGTVERVTMLWDGAGALVPARARPADGGERHLPEPDLPPLVLTSDWIDEQRRRVPSRPAARREHLARDFGIGGPALDVLTADPELADFYESVARRHGDPRAAAEWVLGPVLDTVEAAGGDLDAFSLRVRPADLADLLGMLRDGQLGPAGAKHVFGIMARTGDPAARVAKREGLWPARGK